MRKPVSILVVLALCVPLFAFAACGDDAGGSGGESGDKTIYINQFAKGIRAFTRRSEGIKAAAKQNGWTVIEDAYGDGTPETQIRQIQNVLTKRPSAIFLIPINPEALTPVIRQAKSQGIDVVTMGSNVSDADEVVSFVSYEPEELGQTKAEYIAKQLNGKGRVGVVNGLRGADFAEGQLTGLKATFAKYPNIEIVDGGYTDWTSEQGLKTTENLLQRAGNLDAIYYAGDDLAVGGIQAIKQRGIKPDEIVTVGSDATPAAVDLIKRGDLTYTTSSCSFAAGLLAATTLEKHWEGQSVPKSVPVTQIPITKDNVTQVEAKPKEECGA